MVHPYTTVETTLEDGASFIPLAVKFDPTKPYFAHIDLGLKKDSCGLAVGHMVGWKQVDHNKNGLLVSDNEPVIAIDLMLKINAPQGGEIQVDYVRALLLELRSYGCNFKKITYDQYQSASSIQAFQRMGIESDKMSVDRPMDAYNAFKEAILEGRLLIYEYQPFVEEVVRLEYKEAKDKVDHPPKGSKDICDAVAGVVYHIVLTKQYAALDPSYGMMEANTGGVIPDGWVNPAGNSEPTMFRDKNGEYRLKPGAKLRTVDAMLWDDDDDDTNYPVGFA
jgi:hypothetical protein